MSDTDTCCYCKQTIDRAALRPYGTDGKLTCLPCAMLPDNRETTDTMFTLQFEAVRAMSNTIIIGGINGPEPGGI